MSFEDIDDFTEEGWARTLTSCSSNAGGDEMAWDTGGGQPGGKPKYQHKQNRGSMFENGHKTKEKQPDFTGSVNVDGTIYWLNGWKELTQSGKKRISVSVQRQDEQRQSNGGQQKRASW